MEISEIKDILNSIISEDLNLKEIIRCIDHIALDNFDSEISRNADKYLSKLSNSAIISMEKTRCLLLKLAKSIGKCICIEYKLIILSLQMSFMGSLNSMISGKNSIITRHNFLSLKFGEYVLN